MAKKAKEKSELDLMVEKIVRGHKSGTINYSEAMDEIQSKVVQSLLEGEMDTHLGYEKNSFSQKETSNRRNGYSSKERKINTSSGQIEVSMPRDREGSFEPVIVSKRQKSIKSDFEEKIVLLYSRGNSYEDIKVIIKEMYGFEPDNEFINNAISRILNVIEEWKIRLLKKCYPFVYVDCIQVPMKKDLVSVNHAVYVMLGIDTEGNKEVMGIWFDENESATFWTGIFNELKERGVEDIFVMSMDGLSGLEKAVQESFPKTNTQRCIVHIMRNIYKVINKKEPRSIMEDIKRIYKSPNIEYAKDEYEKVKEKYKENKLLIHQLEKNKDHMFKLFEYPTEIRKIIYTTNPIESVNSALRKVTNGKGSFPHEESVMKVLYLRTMDLEERWRKKKSNWSMVLNKLILIYGDRILKHIEL